VASGAPLTTISAPYKTGYSTTAAPPAQASSDQAPLESLGLVEQDVVGSWNGLHVNGASMFSSKNGRVILTKSFVAFVPQAGSEGAFKIALDELESVQRGGQQSPSASSSKAGSGLFGGLLNKAVNSATSAASIVGKNFTLVLNYWEDDLVKSHKFGTMKKRDEAGIAISNAAQIDFI
jgi:hypothetical protein